MKGLIFVLTLLSVFASQAKADAALFGTDLPVRIMDAQHFEGIEVTNSFISIDQEHSSVRLSISGYPKYHTMHCRVDSLSCRPRPIFENFELPIVDDVQDSCGRTVTAVRDARMVDGLKQTITIYEYNPMANALCVGTDYPVSVSYKTEGFDRLQGLEIRAESLFYGQHLKILSAILPIVIPDYM